MNPEALVSGFEELSLHQKYLKLRAHRHYVPAPKYDAAEEPSHLPRLSEVPGVSLPLQVVGDTPTNWAIPSDAIDWYLIQANIDELLVELSNQNDEAYEISDRGRGVTALPLLRRLKDVATFDHWGPADIGSQWRQPPRLEFFRQFLPTSRLVIDAWPPFSYKETVGARRVNEEIARLRKELRSPRLTRAADDWNKNAQRACEKWKALAKKVFQRHSEVLFVQAVLALLPNDNPPRKADLEEIRPRIKKLIAAFNEGLFSPGIAYFCKIDWSPAHGYHAYFTVLLYPFSQKLLGLLPIEILRTQWRKATDGKGNLISPPVLPAPHLIGSQGVIRADDQVGRQAFDGWVIEVQTLSTQQFKARAPKKTKLLTCDTFPTSIQRCTRVFHITPEMQALARIERTISLERSSYTDYSKNAHISLNYAATRAAIVRWIDRIVTLRRPLFKAARNGKRSVLEPSVDGQNLLDLLVVLPELFLTPHHAYLIELDPRISLFMKHYEAQWGRRQHELTGWTEKLPHLAAKYYNNWVKEVRHAAAHPGFQARLAKRKKYRERIHSFLTNFFHRADMTVPDVCLLNLELQLERPALDSISLPMYDNAPHEKLALAMAQWTTRVAKRHLRRHPRIAWKIHLHPSSNGFMASISILAKIRPDEIDSVMQKLHLEWAQISTEKGINLAGFLTSVDNQGLRYRGSKWQAGSDPLSWRIQRRMAYMTWSDEYDSPDSGLEGRSIGVWPHDEELSEIWFNRPRLPQSTPPSSGLPF